MTDRNMKLCEDYRAIHRKHIAKGESSDVVTDKICLSFFITEVRFLEQGGQDNEQGSKSRSIIFI